MPTKGFDAGKFLTDLNGKDYLEVKWRLLWLRTEHPDAVIETELVKHDAGLALFRARVAIPGGGVASGWGSETADDFKDFIEKAETKALGRALAALGFGTQFCEDFDFSADRTEAVDQKRGRSNPSTARSEGRGGETQAQRRVVDAPVSRRSLKVVRDSATVNATASQVKAIYSIARGRHQDGDAGVEERCRTTYGCLPAKLSKRQASEFIDVLRQPAADGAAPKVKAARAERNP